jgi:hypothetical protein
VPPRVSNKLLPSLLESLGIVLYVTSLDIGQLIVLKRGRSLVSLETVDSVANMVMLPRIVS